MPFGCHASTMTVLSVMGAVLMTLVLGVVGVGLVWLVRRTRRRWKEVEYEELDGEGQRSSRRRGWDLGLASFVGLFPVYSRTEGQPEDEEEIRPLLE